MHILLKRKGVIYSKLTVHKYMNKELKLLFIVRRKKPGYFKGDAPKVFSNLLNQNFSVSAPNTVWCTDFTYMYLKNGKEITAELAINTLKTALHKVGKIIVHSDQ